MLGLIGATARIELVWRVYSVGDCSKVEAREYFFFLLKYVPDGMKDGLDFEEVYKVFGGKLAHINGATFSH